jgi:hypothetical protein
MRGIFLTFVTVLLACWNVLAAEVQIKPSATPGQPPALASASPSAAGVQLPPLVGFRRAAAEDFRVASFIPTYRDGKPVECGVTLPVYYEPHPQ